MRAMHWYSHYRHSVFTMIQSCFEDDGASGLLTPTCASDASDLWLSLVQPVCSQLAQGVVMIGIQPGLERVMTCLEWPCIQQDLCEAQISWNINITRWQTLEPRKSAFDEKKAPFYDKGKQLLDFRKINFKRICLEDLSSLEWTGT